MRSRGPGVQVIDIAAAQGVHHDLVPRLACLPPGVDEGVPGHLGAGGEGHPPRLVVGRDGSDYGAGAQFGQGLVLPHLVLLATVLLQLYGGQLFGQGTEGPARSNLWQLTGIAGQHDLGSPALGMSEEASELPGLDHPGLIDHHDRAWG